MFFFRLFSKLPFFVLYAFADLLAFIAFRLVRYRYTVVFENMTKSFPEKTHKEIRQLAKQFYHHMADWMIETLKALSMSEQTLKERVIFKNTKSLQQLLQEKKSLIVLTAHQFNWEWVLLSGNLTFGLPIDAIYMPVSNPTVEKLLLAIRSRFGGLPIPKDQTLPTIVKRIKEQRMIAMVADQRPAQDIPDKYWTTFLHQDTAFYMGTESLPKLTRLPVFFMATRKIKRGYYEVTIEKLAEPPYQYQQKEILPAYIHRVEDLIKEHPDNWLWSHNRWKYGKGAYD